MRGDLARGVGETNLSKDILTHVECIAFPSPEALHFICECGRTERGARWLGDERRSQFSECKRHRIDCFRYSIIQFGSDA